jgi:penicillin-binding protein-related factor A (putative recombinase)
VTPEGLIEKQILNWLKMKNVFAWKTKTVGTFDPTKKVFRKPSPFYRKGVSDIIALIEGRLIAIEVKSKTGRVSQEQIEFLNQINARGGVGFIARSIEDVEMHVNGLLRQALQEPRRPGSVD